MTAPVPQPIPLDWPSLPTWCSQCEVHQATNREPLCPLAVGPAHPPVLPARHPAPAVQHLHGPRLREAADRIGHDPEGRPAVTAPYPDFDGTQVCAQGDPEAFHPELGERTDAAKRICKGGELGYKPACAFLEPCLLYALHHQVSGVWGGTSGQERRIMRSRLGIVAQPLSFGTGPNNATIAKRMAGRGTSVAHIADHLGVTHEAVHRILRSAEAARRDPDARDSQGRVMCADCGRRLLPDSMRKHKRDYCTARQVAS